MSTIALPNRHLASLVRTFAKMTADLLPHEAVSLMESMRKENDQAFLTDYNGRYELPYNPPVTIEAVRAGKLLNSVEFLKALQCYRYNTNCSPEMTRKLDEMQSMCIQSMTGYDRADWVIDT